MNRTTVARWRELASLLVVGVLLAVAVAPAGAASGPSMTRRGGLVSGPPAPWGSASGSALALALELPWPGARIRPSILAPRPAERPRTPGPIQIVAPAPGCRVAPADVRAARVVSHGSRSRHVVALTFDDGYGPVNTLRILAILQRFHVNATFFPVGRAIEMYPAVWRRVADAGFPIADHTYDHPSLAGLCYASQLRELERQQSVVRDVLGIEPLPVMRPPYGARDRLTAYAARAAGDLRVVLWDVDTRDWSGINWWRVYKRGVVGGNGSIVLMHTFPSVTVTALPRIIAAYRRRGFEFVTVGQLLGIPGPVPFG